MRRSLNLKGKKEYTLEKRRVIKVKDSINQGNTHKKKKSHTRVKNLGKRIRSEYLRGKNTQKSKNLKKKKRLPTEKKRDQNNLNLNRLLKRSSYFHLRNLTRFLIPNQSSSCSNSTKLRKRHKSKKTLSLLEILKCPERRK